VSGRFAGEHAVVVGLGSSGRAAAAALLREGAEVRVSESQPRSTVGEVPDGVDVLAGGHEPGHLDGATLVIVSPGVAEATPVIGWALERGLPVWSELELGVRLCAVPYVAITGTNGKTTTTELVAAAMRAGGLAARACGNVGYPLSTAAAEPHDALAVECSSFQLRFTPSLHPRVSVLLNLAPDHLDWHGSFEAYGAAKAGIHRNQSGDDRHVGNLDDTAAAALSRLARCEVRWFREGPPAEGQSGFDGRRVMVRASGGDVVMEAEPPPSVARPFLVDAAAAASAALAFGIGPDAVRSAIEHAEPGPHRGAVVATVGSVRFVDDSKATNPHAALAALEGRTNVVLVAGGLAKGVDLSPLARAVPSLRAVVAIGEAAPAIAEVFDGLVPVRRAGSMEEAVAAAFDAAAPDGTVLLAPACASQDMFRDYGDRGDRFAAAARALTTTEPRPHRPAVPDVRRSHA
jgi:UDP-N-acetylmuramoylalanine--D-glutamate ligase